MNIYLKQPLLFSVFWAIMCNTALAQSSLAPANPTSSTQLGMSAKASIEFLKGIPQLRLGLNAGIGQGLFENVFYPSVNVEWQIYYRGLGTRSGAPGAKKNFTSDIMIAATATAGINYLVPKMTNEELSWRNKPLYYFTEFVHPALENPYRYSMSVGTNVMFALDPGKKTVQRIGFVNAHIGAFQFNYYNDGGGFQDIGIGDGEDRYFTGGGFAAVNLNAKNDLNQFSISYHKFSGFQEEAFDLAGNMNLMFVNYYKTDQGHYNKSFWSFSAGDVSRGVSAFFRINNPYNRWDFQNMIHYSGNDAYHQIPYSRHYSFGGSYFQSRTKFGIK
jgi:hypothetical protein